MDGVLPSQQILELCKQGKILVSNPEPLVQPNSLDLPFGRRAWRLSSIRMPRATETILDVIKELAIEELDLSRQIILERNAVYIVELAVQMKLPSDVRGECDSKSSTGRIDVQTRLLTDHNERYDFMPPGYTGPIYLFVSSNSFLIRVHAGLCLNQARFTRGEAVLGDAAAKKLVEERGLLYRDGAPVKEVQTNTGIILTLDLHEPIAGYRAKFTNQVVDLSRLDNPKEPFWETIAGGNDSITLERDQFYILSTNEAIRIPHDFGAWIPPFRPEYGEFRSHYAGFYDAGFGYGNGELLGATTTLEVRSQDNSLTLLHGTPISPMLFLKLTASSTLIYNVQIKSNYQSQKGPKLAKYFK